MLFLFIEILSSVQYSHIGCFKDKQARAIPTLQDDGLLVSNNTRTSLPSLGKDSSERLEDATRQARCALAAARRGHNVFVVMADGQCASGPNTGRNFVKFGFTKHECSTMTASNVAYILGHKYSNDLLKGKINTGVFLISALTSF